MITVRRIKFGESRLYREIRLASLKESPAAFASTYEAASERGDSSWREQSDGSAHGADRATFLALADQKPVGIAALYRDDLKRENGEVIQVWIEPAYRGGEVAKELLQAVFSWAQENEFRALSAWVNVENERAIRYYQRNGFQRTNEIRPLKVGSCAMTCLLMKQISPAYRSNGERS